MAIHPTTHPSNSWLFASLVSFLVSGCSGTTQDQHLFREFVEDGVTIAATSGGPLHNGDLFTYERSVVLEQDPDRAESLLYYGQERPWDDVGFLRDGDGRFYVQDRGNYRIAVFDEAGRFERSIGRQGEGPGEFRFLYLTGMDNGVLEIWDGSLSRITFYRTDGTLEGTMVSPVGGTRVYYNRASELFVFRNFHSEQPEAITWVGAGFQARTAGGDLAGEASTPLIANYFPYYWEGHKGGVGSETIPFTCYPAMAWAQEYGILLTNGIEPALWLYSPDGTLIRKITLELPPQPVTRGDRQRYITDLNERLEVAEGDDRIILTSVRENLAFSESKSYWRAVQIDDRGYIWLEIPEWDRDLSGIGPGCLYYVLSPEGEYLGSTRAPVAGRVMNGHLLGVVGDPETGREDYTVWRLIPQPEGFVYP